MTTRSTNHVPGGVVITTINPRGSLEHQSQCLKAWKELGLRVISFNAKKESSQVSELYGSVAEVFELDEDATAIQMHGTPAPRIRPVLQIVLEQMNPQYVFLTNSDIYPSFRKAPLTIFDSYPAYAFTRKEVISIECGEQCEKMYRGGLDIFAFNAHALATVCTLLHDEACSEQMAFGIPGWDYFMGATVSRPEIGGIIVDGIRFWHKAHRTTYSQIEQFSVFIPYLIRLGFVRSHSCGPAAAEFAAHIERQCRAHTQCATMIELMYGKLGTTIPWSQKMDHLLPVYEIIQNDDSLNNYEEHIAQLDKYITNPQMNLEGLQTYMLRSESQAARFQELLVMIYLTLLVRAAHGRRTLRTKFPVGNAHMPAIRHILSERSFYVRRYQLAELFFTEYFIYNILNRNDLKALALSCINDQERAMLKKIILFTNHDPTH
jgi:hypothetical protein